MAAHWIEGHWRGESEPLGGFGCEVCDIPGSDCDAVPIDCDCEVLGKRLSVRNLNGDVEKPLSAGTA